MADKAKEQGKANEAGFPHFNLLLLLFGIVLLAAAFQAVQILSSSGQVSQQGIDITGMQSLSQENQSYGSESTPTSNLEDLPDMVGGC